ncbi:MAG: HNH endonuclease [Planctomycetes bacterium]|nr:HNH endonuclease [Planctomycetota bacterium]
MSRCLVLNANYEYLAIEERWIDALGLVIAGKADVLEAYPETVRSQYLTLPLPAVVVMRYLVRTRRRRAIFDAASRTVVFTRDGFTCQYCGVRVSMATGTRDHVMPRSRGGPDLLSNVVTACRACNTRKGDRTPTESGMHPKHPPRGLTEEEKLACLLKTVRTRERSVWQACLRRHGITLWTSRAA